MGAYDRYVTDQGQKILNGRTLKMWNEVEYILDDRIPILQGSYNKGGVAASAGAHDGGGAVDSPHKVKLITTNELVRAMRKVGFAAWYRPTQAGLWVAHIHAIALGDKEASQVAKNQMKAYLDGYNGLGNLGRGGRDTGPRDIIQTWEEYKAKHPKRFPNG